MKIPAVIIIHSTPYMTSPATTRGVSKANAFFFYSRIGLKFVTSLPTPEQNSDCGKQYPPISWLNLLPRGHNQK